MRKEEIRKKNGRWAQTVEANSPGDASEQTPQELRREKMVGKGYPPHVKQRAGCHWTSHITTNLFFLITQMAGGMSPHALECSHNHFLLIMRGVIIHKSQANTAFLRAEGTAWVFALLQNKASSVHQAQDLLIQQWRMERKAAQTSVFMITTN